MRNSDSTSNILVVNSKKTSRVKGQLAYKFTVRFALNRVGMERGRVEKGGVGLPHKGERERFPKKLHLFRFLA